MTYADLKALLNEFTDTQLKQTVTVYVRGDDGFYDVNWDDVKTSSGDCDELGPGHKYIVI